MAKTIGNGDFGQTASKVMEYLPAIGTSLSTSSNKENYGGIAPTIYYAGDVSGGRYVDPNSTANTLLKQRMYEDQLSANRNAMFRPTFNEDTLREATKILDLYNYNKYIPQETTYDFGSILTPQEFITGDFTQRDFLNDNRDKKSFIRGF